jgi:hypothetical protein
MMLERCFRNYINRIKENDSLYNYGGGEERIDGFQIYIVMIISRIS